MAHLAASGSSSDRPKRSVRPNRQLRMRRYWPKTHIIWRGDSHYGRVEALEWAEDNDADYIFGLAGNAALDALVAETADYLRFHHAMSSIWPWFSETSCFANVAQAEEPSKPLI